MRMLSPTFWQGKKVFITGHTGFKGSWLSLWLQLLKADVIGFSLKDPPTCPNLYSLAHVKEGMTSITGNICDFSLLLKNLKAHRPDIIIHMAAQSLVQHSYQHPIETYATNVMGTVNLLEAAKQIDSVKVIINVTTDKCYENKEWHQGYCENDRLGGDDPYSNSKACSELVTAAYLRSFFNEQQIGIASVRAGNVIGGGDWAKDRLVPDIIRAIINNQPVSIRNPSALRPWQHVLEPLNGYLLLAERLFDMPQNYSESWNFGPDEEDIKSVQWVVEHINHHWNKNNEDWLQDQKKYPHEAQHLKLDCSKAKTKLGWHCNWNLEKSLKETCYWYQAYLEKKDIRELTLHQIINFNGIARPKE